MSLAVKINGRERVFEQLDRNCGLQGLLAALELKPDRVAVELNGTICSRKTWDSIEINSGDRLEIVQFVGGGASSRT